MADNNIKIILELEKGGATASLKNFEGDLIKSGVAVKDLRSHFGNFILSTRKARAEVKLTSKELGNLSKTVGGFQSATGGASSAAMELGRVISDAPYGIRGMANNITQLVSQLGYQAAATNTATGATYGYAGALKAMWASLTGPLGVVFAITTAVSALDFFAGSAKSAKEETKDLTKSLDEMLSKLNDIEGKVPDAIEAVFEKLGLETNAFDEFAKNMGETVKILNNEFPEFKKAYDKLSETQKKDPKVISDLIHKYRELINVRKDIKNQEEVLKELNKASGEYAESNLKRGREIYKDLLLRKAELENIFKEEEKREGKKKKKDRVENLFSFDKKMTKKEAENLVKAFKDAVKDKLSDEDQKLLDSLILASPLTEQQKQDVKEYTDKIRKEIANNLILDSKLESFQDYAETTQQALSSINDFISAQYDRQLTIEQNHTNALNEELNNRLLNENLSVSERKRIQNQIAQNDEALRKKQNEIKKKQFNTQKAYNIANALIDTGRAAAGVMAEAKGGFFSRLAQAIPTIAFGLAQVATIASQKFQPEAASTPIRTASGGAGGGGAGNRTFDFNLVGNNQNNQIAEAIGSQFDKPLKAYVVSKDVTNAQQLDANIKSSARFGG